MRFQFPGFYLEKEDLHKEPAEIFPRYINIKFNWPWRGPPIQLVPEYRKKAPSAIKYVTEYLQSSPGQFVDFEDISPGIRKKYHLLLTTSDITYALLELIDKKWIITNSLQDESASGGWRLGYKWIA